MRSTLLESEINRERLELELAQAHALIERHKKSITKAKSGISKQGDLISRLREVADVIANPSAPSSQLGSLSTGQSTLELQVNLLKVPLLESQLQEASLEIETHITLAKRARETAEDLQRHCHVLNDRLNSSLLECSKLKEIIRLRDSESTIISEQLESETGSGLEEPAFLEKKRIPKSHQSMLLSTPKFSEIELLLTKINDLRSQKFLHEKEQTAGSTIDISNFKISSYADVLPALQTLAFLLERDLLAAHVNSKTSPPSSVASEQSDISILRDPNFKPVNAKDMQLVFYKAQVDSLSKSTKDIMKQVERIQGERDKLRAENGWWAIRYFDFYLYHFIHRENASINDAPRV